MKRELLQEGKIMRINAPRRAVVFWGLLFLTSLLLSGGDPAVFKSIPRLVCGRGACLYQEGSQGKPRNQEYKAELR